MIRLLLALLALAWPMMACAHESRPAYLELIETGPGTWHIVWKQPVMGDSAVKLEPRLSNGWLARQPRAEQLTSSHYLRSWQIAAPASQLAGATLTIGGLEQGITDVLVHLRSAKGKGGDTILSAGNPAMTIDFGNSQARAARAYFGLGVEHILGGADHLLLVAGLVLLVAAGWRLVGVITAFTAGHSLTLAASTLGWVEAPVATIEALVALSLVFVARELLVGGGLASRKPWLIAALFGLLHGFAFAGSLAETGLPEGDIPLALLLFNLGVEAGQLLFVAALLVLMLVWRRMPIAANTAALTRRLAPYGIGCYAGMLFAERTAAAFA